MGVQPIFHTKKTSTVDSGSSRVIALNSVPFLRLICAFEISRPTFAQLVIAFAIAVAIADAIAVAIAVATAVAIAMAIGQCFFHCHIHGIGHFFSSSMVRNCVLPHVLAAHDYRDTLECHTRRMQC